MSLFDLVTLGIPGAVHSIARILYDEADKCMSDEKPVKAKLMELQQRYEYGEISKEEYEREEKLLMDRLTEIRKYKKRMTDDR